MEVVDLSISHLHGSNGVTEKIKKAMYESAKQFVYIGFLLKEVRDYKYYGEGGYEDVYTYAEFELGFKRSSTKNFIAIAETFGIQEWKYQGITQKSQSMSLQPEYEKFNYSQLVELLAMSPAQRQAAKPEMTVRDLRSMKQKDREEAIRSTPQPPSMLPQVTGQTSGQERWIPFKGKSPQIGKYQCKLVIHIVYLNGKPKEDIDFGFYRDGKWTNREGHEILEVTHYRELPEFPHVKPPLADPNVN